MASQIITRTCLGSSSCSPTRSAARVFLQLTLRRGVHSTAPPLDFLLPAPSARYGWSLINPMRQIESKRFITASLRRNRTTAIFNPRRDSHGNSLHIEITPRASNRLKQIMAKDSNPNLALRIQVENGGCHGFQYLMSLTSIHLNTSSGIQASMTNSSPKITINDLKADDTNDLDSGALRDTDERDTTKAAFLNEDDTVFAADDGSGAKIVMDGPSLELLNGSKVDFTMELIGSQFKVVDNPLATSNCGCGTSFDIK